MKLTIDKYDDGTCYVDLRFGEELTQDAEARALRFARKHHRDFIEVWRARDGVARFERLLLATEAA